MITAERLRHVLNYNAETGLFHWTAPTHPRIKIGDLAGFIDSRGYRMIRIDGHGYSAHRLAVLWMTGSWPAKWIDHVNRVRSDNSWGNIREATVTQNLANRPVMPSSKTGSKGVYWSQRHKKYAARIRVNGERIFLGYFSDVVDATQSYEREAASLYGEYANLTQKHPILGREQIAKGMQNAKR